MKFYDFSDISLSPKILSIKKLDDIVNKYINTYHSTIKMNHVVVHSNTDTDFEQNF